MDAVLVISNLFVELAVVRLRRADAGDGVVRLLARAIKPASPEDVNGFLPPNLIHQMLDQTQITVGLLSQTTELVDVSFDQIAVISVRMDAVLVISNLFV